MIENTVPRLIRSSRLKSLLSLWNPLYYFQLFYWIFFFTQALRWYVEQFGKSEYRDAKGYEEVKYGF